MTRLLPLTLLAAVLGQSADFRLSKDGFGPLVMRASVNTKHRRAVVTLSGRNDSGWPISYALFCLKAPKENGCAFRFWNTDLWERGDVMEWSSSGPAHKGIETPDLYLVALQRLVPDLRQVATLFVENITGDAGPMTRSEILSLLANGRRFRVVADEREADAVIEGAATTIEGPTVTSSHATGQAGVGMLGGIAIAGGAAGSVSSTQTILRRSLALHVIVTKTKQMVWGYDDTRPCAGSRVKCAVDDLVACAGAWSK